MTITSPASPQTHEKLATFEDPDEGRAHPRRRGRTVVAVAALVLVLAAVVVVRSRSDATAPAAAPAVPTTAAASTKTITTEASFDGTISYATAVPVVSRVSGRITTLQPEAKKVTLGDVLFAVDGSPSVLFYGSLPAWRSLSAASTPGPDIEQLERSLVALGYDPDGAVTVDDTFTDATTIAVERWQKALGLEQTGTVTLGSVVFEPTEVVVGAHQTNVGAPIADGGIVATVLSNGATIEFTIPADAKTLIAIDQKVDVTMPDRSAAKGTITAIGTVTDASTGDVSTVGRGTVDLGPSTAPFADGASIKVRVGEVIGKDVLVVPAAAIASYVDGTFTVTVMNADGSTREVPVKTGVSGSGSVEVSGDGITAGTKVVLPSSR